MATKQLQNVVQTLRRAIFQCEEVARTDGQLLESYIRRREEAAFAALVQRHGPMVWGVCQRILRSSHDAEDAFQATFLVLVRKASSILPKEMVGNWLYGVAHQTALKARATTARRSGCTTGWQTTTCCSSSTTASRWPACPTRWSACSMRAPGCGSW